MVDTRECKSSSLEQVAAHCGHRPWREFCEMQRKYSKLRKRVGEMRKTIAALRASDGSRGGRVGPCGYPHNGGPCSVCGDRG